MTGKTRRAMPAWLKGLVAPFRRNATLAIALGIVTACFSALLMFSSGYLISRTAQPSTTLFMVMVPVAFVQVFGIGRPIARYFERLVSHDWVFRVTSGLRARLFSAIASRGEGFTEKMATGDYLELLADDIGHLQNLYLRTAFPIAIGLALYVLSGLFCGFFTIPAAVALFGISALSAIAMPLLAHVIARPVQRRSKELRSAEYADLTDDVLGATDLALAGKGATAAASHETRLKTASASAASVRRIVRVAECASAVALALFAVAAVCAASIAFQQSADDVNFIAAFGLGAFPLIEAFALMPQALVGLTDHDGAIARLDGIISTAPKPIGHPGSTEQANGGALAIDARGVSFCYPGASRPALDQLSLSVAQGQRLAILGRSGSGKSTFAALVRGAVAPQSGSVMVNGKPAAMASGTPEVAYLSQAPYVFDQTLRENLAIADESATDGRLVEALAAVGLSGKLDSLPMGLDAHVGETGAGFSGGEAHRLALARALLANSSVIVLDEPFAAVDPATERMLMDTLFRAFDGKTLVVITHHLACIERFDRVVFIEGGRVSLDGNPAELIEEGGRFAQLVELDRDIAG